MRKITRHNYEELFILYLDNELTVSEKNMVDAFLQLHTDLREEFDLLKHFKLEPDTEIQFPDKEKLRKLGNEAIPAIQVQEWLLLDLDGELHAAAATELSELLASDPQIAREKDQLSRTKLVPEHISFGDRSILYRHEEKQRPVFSMRWMRIAAAVLLLLLAGGAFILFNRQSSSTDPQVNDVAAEVRRGADPVSAVKESIIPTDKQSLVTTEIKNESTVKAPQEAVSVKQDQQKPIIPRNEAVVQQAVANNEIPSNHLPQPEQSTALTAPSSNNPGTASALTIPSEHQAVTIVATQPLNIRYASETVDVKEDQADGRKNKLRGLFRKVTRNFEKRTNIDPTDDDRLLVAGLAIKLK